MSIDPTDPRQCAALDALAAALRAEQHGAIRPLWSELDEARRNYWRERARVLWLALLERGFDLIESGGEA